MSSLSVVLAMVVGATAPCSSSPSDEDVPLRLEQWNEDDASWLEQELSGWVSQRDRRLCNGAGGLTIEATQLEAVITFVFQAMRRTRTVPRDTDSRLFRYQVAAAAEELVRSTWEAPPPPRFVILGRGEGAPLASGHSLFGGSLGAGLFVLPSLCLEVFAHLASLLAPKLSTGGSVTGLQVGGLFSASWLPVRIGVLRVGVRASFRAGALSVRVQEDGSTDANGTAPWLVAGGGASIGLETRKLLLLVYGELGYAFSGAAVQVEGVQVQSIRGTAGHLGLQVGWLW